MKKIVFGLILAMILTLFLSACIQNNGMPNKTPSPKPTVGTQTPSLEEMKDCGKDIDCFIRAAENCSRAKYVSTYAQQFNGVKKSNSLKLDDGSDLNYLSVVSIPPGALTQNHIWQVELKGLNNGRCILYLKNAKTDFVFGPDFPQELKEDVLKYYNPKDASDIEMTCNYEVSYLKRLLQDWKNLDFSKLDISHCESLAPTVFIIPPICENCTSGYMNLAITQDINKKSLNIKYYECGGFLTLGECKKGYHCFENTCLSNSVFLEMPSCVGYNPLNPETQKDPCEVYSCENCKKGRLTCHFSLPGGSPTLPVEPEELQYKCVECVPKNFGFISCKEGFKCENYKCVKAQ